MLAVVATVEAMDAAVLVLEASLVDAVAFDDAGAVTAGLAS